MRSHSLSETNRIAARKTATPDPLRGFLRNLAEGFRRARQRRDLAALSDYHLRDIGLCRSDVAREIGKPFWC